MATDNINTTTKPNEFVELEPKQAQVVAQPQQVNNTPTYDSKKILDDIWNLEPEEPKFDAERQKRLERAAKVNAVGQGIGVLGDIISLGVGGNVNRRQPDTTTPALFNSYQNYLDNYNNKVDTYNYNKYRNALTKGNMLLQQNNLDRNFEANQDYRDYQKSVNDRNFEANQGYRDQQQENWEKNFEATNDYRTEQQKAAQNRWEAEMEYKKNLPYVNAALESQKLATRLAYDREKNAYTLMDERGVPRHQLKNDGEIQKLYTLIASDPKMQEDINARMKVLKSQFGEGVNMNHMKVIVSEYWDKVPAAEKYLSREDNTQSNSGYLTRPAYPGAPLRIDGNNNTGSYHPTQPTTPQQTTEQPTEDWSQYELK